MCPRSVLVPCLAILIGGCAKKEPLLAHGRPVSHWLQALHDPDPKTRKKAVVALGHVGTADSTAIPAVIEAVKDPDPAVRAEAVLALLNLGPDAKDAIPALTEAQTDRDAKVREYTGMALERIQGSK
jgi:HEAT repeat protein